MISARLPNHREAHRVYCAYSPTVGSSTADAASLQLATIDASALEELPAAAGAMLRRRDEHSIRLVVDRGQDESKQGDAGEKVDVLHGGCC